MAHAHFLGHHVETKTLALILVYLSVAVDILGLSRASEHATAPGAHLRFGNRCSHGFPRHSVL